MKKEKFIDQLNRYIEGKATEEEIKQFDSFYDSFQQDENNWDDLGLTDKEKIKLEIYLKIKLKVSERQMTIKKSIPYAMKIAASFLLIIGLSFAAYLIIFRNHRENKPILITCTTKLGERKEIILSDSTKVLLNAGSRFSYTTPFAKDKREVALTGEAYFNVSKDPDRPFIIKTGEISTTVLGTTFNVSAYENEDVSVAVATGNVKVSYSPPGIFLQQLPFLHPGRKQYLTIKIRHWKSLKLMPKIIRIGKTICFHLMKFLYRKPS